MTAPAVPPPDAERPLIAAPARWVAIVAVAMAVAGFVLLAFAVGGRTTGTAFDYRVAAGLDRHVGNDLAALLLGSCNPVLTTVLSVLVALAAAALRRWRTFALTALAPLIAILLTEVVFKPLVARHLSYHHNGRVYISKGYGFPSGHETGLASFTFDSVLLIWRAIASIARRVFAVVVLLVWTGAGALGLVRRNYHYATDTLGALCVSLVCVLGVALLVDRYGPTIALRVRRRRRQLT